MVRFDPSCCNNNGRYNNQTQDETNNKYQHWEIVPIKQFESIEKSVHEACFVHLVIGCYLAACGYLVEI